MYSYDEILARLRKGEDTEKIAREMTEALNKASKDYEAENSRSQKQKEFEKECANAANAMNKAILAYARLEGVDMEQYLWNADNCAKTIGAYKSLGMILNTILGEDELRDLRNTVRDTTTTVRCKKTTQKSENDFATVMRNFLDSIDC